MNVRRNIYTLSPSALADFQAALNAVKADGSYDDFIVRHHHSMMEATLMPGESGDATLRNVAHRGPAFLPWHRYFCRELELLLQTKNPNVTLPYWDWSADAANPAGAPLWNGNPANGPVSIGGDGTGPGSVITTGPFAWWTALIESASGTLVPRAGIVRELGSWPSLPSAADVTDVVQNFPEYDTTPWHLGSINSFRNRLEGWDGGPALHNQVHLWVGGDMGPGTSPNDPVFFLHHCNVDRIWSLWQTAHPAAAYAPASGGPLGHNLNDTMAGLTSASPTPKRALDHRRNLGFIYDTDPPLVDLVTPTVTFQDVPTLETTWRAAVFHVRAGSPVHFSVVPGSGPGAPYSLTALGPSVTHVPAIDNAPFDTVRVWFAFTGDANPGPAPAGSAQIACVETGQTFTITLNANTVARPTTGVVFCLDHSLSMAQPAGSGPTRIEVLRQAADRCVALIRDGSGAGMVSFNHDAHPGVALAPFSPSTSQRADVVNAVDALTPAGNTSIGDGVELARQTLAAGATAFSGQALVVLTDGLENSPKLLSEVTGSIDQRTFAIGLGAAQQVSTAALTQLANGTGGYLLLTGALTPDTDGYFRLSKYFQQILVAATNESIVVDPSGFVSPKQEVRVPFALTETDIDATAVALFDVPVVRLALETPDGTRLEEGDLAALGAEVITGDDMTFCRFALPLPIGDGAHGGTWQLVLGVDGARFKRELSALKRAGRRDPEARERAERLEALGARWSVVVSSWTNLRMNARATQSSLNPGASIRLDATLTEFGLPVAGRARVVADVTRPDGFTSLVSLAEEQGGAFAATFPGAQEGVWRMRVRASGTTFAGVPFTREQTLTAAILRGGDVPPVRDPTGEIVCLLRCLLDDDGVRRCLKERGVDVDGVLQCARHCQETGVVEDQPG